MGGVMSSKRIRTDFVAFDGIAKYLTPEEWVKIVQWAQALQDNEVKYAVLDYEKSRYRQPINFIEDLFFPGWVHNGVGLVTLKVDGELVGFYRITRDEEDQTVGTITFVCIGDEFRRKGYGSILMNESRYLLNERGIFITQLCYDKNNEAACAFYEKLGYLTRSIQAVKGAGV
jgi:ribosomal protein S18 acetylase RimI-like enzyme